MFLKSITLKNFKKFAGEHKIDFPEDIIVIKADNEQGKSTLVEAVMTAFFEDPKSKAGRIESYRTWGAKELPRLTLEFENLPEGEFELIKDFKKKEALLKNLTTGESISEIKKIQDELFRMIGIRNREIMEGTAVILQNEVSGIDLKSAMENLITSGEKNIKISETLDDIKKATTEISRGGEKNPGKIRQLDVKIDELNENLKNLLNQYEKSKKLTQERNKLLDSYKKIIEELSLKKEIYETNLEIDEINKKLKELNQRYSENEKEKEMLEKINSEKDLIVKKLAGYKKFAAVNILNTEKELNKKLVQIQIYGERLKEIKAREKYEKSKEAKFALKLKIPLEAFSLILGILGIAGFFLYSADLGAATFLAGLIIFVLSKKFIRKHISYHDIELTETEKKFNSAENELADFLRKLKAKTPEELNSEITEFKELEKKCNILKIQFENLGGKEKLKSLSLSRKDLLKQIGILEEQVEEFRKRKKILLPEEFLKLEKEIKLLEEKREETKSRIDHIEGQLSGLNVSEEKIEDLEKEKIECEKDREKWQYRLRIFDELSKILFESRNDVYKEIKNRLQDSIGLILGIITRGKYGKVSLDEDFNLKVFSEEKGEEILPRQYLSSGAIDQSFLAARLSFLKIISGSHRPFVILDDPFHSFDKIRRAQTKKIIQDYAKDFQIIILTCHDEYDEWGIIKILQ